ncbi:MAG: hypothetical protein Q9213_003795 [Squamulea squamosa]
MGWLEKLWIPNQLDKDFEELLVKLDHQEIAPIDPDLRSPIVGPALTKYVWGDKYHISVGKLTTKISNLSASYIRGSAQAQMEEINQILWSLLEDEVHRSAHDIVFTTILLQSMDDFQAVNQEYSDLFGTEPNPPARVTIACGNSLPQGVNVMVSVVVALGPGAARQHLHVQSMSYWAPANIGPYSQASSVPLGINDTAAVVYVAGQIPLIPSSMEIVTRERRREESGGAQDSATFRLQIILALQHLWRIGKAINVCWWIGAIAFIVAGEDDVKRKALTAALAWTAVHTKKHDVGLVGEDSMPEDASFDVWNKQRIDGQSYMTSNDEFALPDFSCLYVEPDDRAGASSDTLIVPPFFAVEVAQLPRDSQIEWQGLGVSRTPVKFFKTIWEHGNSITACCIVSNEKIFGFIGIKLLSTEKEMYDCIESALSVLQERCKINETINGERTIYTSREIDLTRFMAQIIPCKGVWSIQGEELAAAIVVEYEMDVIK